MEKSSLPEHLVYKPIIYQSGEWEQWVKEKKINVTDFSSYMLEDLLKMREIHAESYPFNLIHYPWLGVFIKCLNEEDFIKVRTSRNRNKITTQEQQTLGSKTVSIIGQSTGSQLAYLLAQERICGSLKLADNDVLSLSNLNRMRGRITELGLYKNIITARAIAELDPYFKIDVLNEKVIESNMDSFISGAPKTDLVIDACDHMHTKFALRLYCQKHAIPLLMDTNDRGRIDIERFDTGYKEIFHGLIDSIDENNISDVGDAVLLQKILDFLQNSGGFSERLSDSLPLLGKQLQSFPQLATETLAGAAVGAICIRKIFLNQFEKSGVLLVDIEELVKNFNQGG